MGKMSSEGVGRAKERNAEVVMYGGGGGGWKGSRKGSLDSFRVAGINCAASGRSQKKIQEWKRPTMGRY